MSGPFQVGDVVVCVNDGACPVLGTACPYKKGAVYRVTDVKTGKNLAGEDVTGIKTTHWDCWWWNVTQFRHLPRADDQFTAEMRACRPIHEQVPA